MLNDKIKFQTAGDGVTSSDGRGLAVAACGCGAVRALAGRALRDDADVTKRVTRHAYRTVVRVREERSSSLYVYR